MPLVRRMEALNNTIGEWGYPMETNTYVIPEDKREEVEKLVSRYQRKAARYGVRLEVGMGKPYAAKRRYWSGNDIVHEEMVEAFDLEIEGDEIRNGNYSVVAKLEHLEGGNIVTTFNGVEADGSWKHIGCTCEHCGMNRDRRLTFIVRDGNGDQKQVGRTCLKDYCGIDPNGIGFANELKDVLLDWSLEGREYDPEQHRGSRAFDTVEMLGLAIAIVKESGYVKSSEVGSNKQKMFDNCKGWRMTESERLEAKAMADGIKAMTDEETAFTVLGNVKTLLESGYCKVEHFGYLAYAPMAWKDYQRKLEVKHQREAEAEAARKSSEYVGEIGQRLTVNVVEAKYITSWENMYGMTHLYKFMDADGNVYVWFASNMIDEAEVKSLKGTVKDHSERDGIKQTVLTRCKVA